MLRLILFTVFIVGNIHGFSQALNQYSVQVSLKNGTHKGKAYLKYFTPNGLYLDSLNFTNGKFSFAGHLPEKIVFAKIYFLPDKEKKLKNENSCEILLEQASIKLISYKNLLLTKFTGTVIQEQFSELQQNLVDIREKQFILNDRLAVAESTNNATEKDKLLAEDFPKLFLEKQKRIGSFIQKHPSSLVSAYKFEEFAGDENINPQVVEPVYNILSNELKKMPIVEAVAKRIDIAKKTAIGMDAIDFIQTDTSGNDVNLFSYKGKYVLLDFWAGWCAPCRAESPMLVKLYNKWKDKGFQIISVSLDGEREQWTKAIIKDKMTWTNVSDLKIFDNAVSKLYGIASIPQNILINPEGKIIGKNLTGRALENLFSDIF